MIAPNKEVVGLGLTASVLAGPPKRELVDGAAYLLSSFFLLSFRLEADLSPNILAFLGSSLAYLAASPPSTGFFVSKRPPCPLGLLPVVDEDPSLKSVKFIVFCGKSSSVSSFS